RVRLDATATVRDWLKDEEKGPTPHLDLAISVEHRVPVRWDHQQDHMEIYNATDGQRDALPYGPNSLERHHHFQIHFKGGDKLSDDEALQRAMELPMARTVTADRNTRPWEGGDCRDGVMVLPEDIVEELEAASMGLIFESVVGKAAKKIEFATLKRNGGVERGYCAVLCQEALTVGKQERPREQFANLQGSRFAWVDDFAPNQPLCSAVLRQISGGNTLTAARKGRGENIFSFHGLLLLCTNGVWQADAEFFGSDRRRITGVKFERNFVDNPTRPHELLKDNSVKQNPEMFAEFWWVARVFWLVTERTAQSTAQPSSMPEASRRYLQPYVLSETRPATSQEVDSYIADQLCVSPTAGRDELKKILMRREGEVIPRFGARTRTSARVYVRPSPRQIMTLVVSA
ncbi:unnamed protein product, partial [Effrenium voratum]